MDTRTARPLPASVILVCAACAIACGGGPASDAAPQAAAASVATNQPAPAANAATSSPAPVQVQGAAGERSGDFAPQLSPPADLDLQRSPSIPLVEGLTLVNAVVEDDGDYEVVMRISRPASDRIQVSYATTRPVDGEPTELRGQRIVLTRDLQSARIYRMRWLAGRAQVARGTTALGLSKEVFEEVRTQGRSECSLSSVEEVGSAIGALGLPSPEYEGILERVESKPVALSVLVDGQREWLPAIHAKGTFEGLTGDVDAEFWFLDDPENPLTLRALVGTARLLVVRIDRPLSAQRKPLETALEQEERVDLPGIYFEFASARLQPESDAALAEVAAVLSRHPEWKVGFEGHTDNIGTAEANLALSRARADAVRQAIAGRLQGDASRLESAGFGLTRPREPNDTPEGRARNRRVEIVRVP